MRQIDKYSILNKLDFVQNITEGDVYQFLIFTTVLFQFVSKQVFVFHTQTKKEKVKANLSGNVKKGNKKEGILDNIFQFE